MNHIRYQNGTTYDLVEDPKNYQDELSLVAVTHMHPDKKNNSHNDSEIKKFWKYLDQVKNIHGSLISAQLVTHRTQGENLLFISGNLSEVLHHTHMPSTEKFSLQKNLEHIMSQGNRIEAVAYGTQYDSNIIPSTIHNLVWLGALVIPTSLQDAVDSIHKKINHKNNSEIKIISDDALHFCKAVARSAGLHCSSHNCVTGSDVRAMTDAEITSIIPHTTVFSELHEADKNRLQRLFSYGQYTEHWI
ncbi:MAG: hypothetical protein ABIP54_04550 [Candidatus Andersenbacteria bacterium]